MRILFILLIVLLLALSSCIQGYSVYEQKETELIKDFRNPNISMTKAHLGIAIIENPEKIKE
ncbi:MAG: hypothetical protein V1906_00350, partial [Candidatus Woesearchaeota archaeon]